MATAPSAAIAKLNINALAGGVARLLADLAQARVADTVFTATVGAEGAFMAFRNAGPAAGIARL